MNGQLHERLFNWRRLAAPEVYLALTIIFVHSPLWYPTPPETCRQVTSSASHISHSFGFAGSMNVGLRSTALVGRLPKVRERPNTRRQPNTMTIAPVNRPIAKNARIKGGDPAGDNDECCSFAPGGGGGGGLGGGVGDGELDVVDVGVCSAMDCAMSGDAERLWVC